MNAHTLRMPTPGSSIRPAKHNIVIVDLSGSMSWAVSDLKTDVIKRINDLPDGDFLSLAYFSSEGEHRWFLKGVKLDASGKQTVADVVQKNFYARNMTCFSEVLATTKSVIDDVAPFSNVVSLAFLSDGHPVVSSLSRETESIFAAISQIKGAVSDAVIVGYGDYYNRELLSKMAVALGAVFTHAGSIAEFGAAFEKTAKKSAVKKVKVKVPKKSTIVFAIDDSGVVSLDVKQDEVEASENSKIVAISETKGAALQQIDDETSLYAGALALCQTGRNDMALEVIGKIGDVHLADILGNALTNDEIGKAEALLKSSVFDSQIRFQRGKKVGCVPKDDAFDIIDCLELLKNDKLARFYPYHPSFSYKAITRKSKQVGNFPKFTPVESGVPFDGLVWHDSRLNLSVRVQIPGTVEIGENELGLDTPYQTHIWRTYNFVYNGFPNVSIVPASVSESVFNKLLQEGVIQKNGSWDQDKIFMLRFDRLPVCNRFKSRGKKSAKGLAEKIVRSTVLAGQIKAYKAILDELSPDKEWKRPFSLTDEQAKFLAEKGIINGAYAPTVEREPATDVLEIREFIVKVAKFSSYPSLKAVREMGEKGKFTPTGSIMWEVVKSYNEDAPKERLEAIEWVWDRLNPLTKERNRLQREIHEAKFGLLMGKSWFDDLDRNDPEIEFNGYNLSFDLKTVQEAI